MPGIRWAYRRDGRGTPIFYEALMGKSQSVYTGDVLALSTNTSVAPASGVPGARTLLAADKSALYGGGTVVSLPAALQTSVSTNPGFVSTSTSGGTIATGLAYFFEITYVTATGETAASAAMASAITTGAGSTNSISITPPVPVANAVGWKVYATVSGGASGSTYYLVSVVNDFTSTLLISTIPSNANLALLPTPPGANTTGGVAGVWGVAQWSGASNAAGQWSAFASVGGAQPGAATYQFPTMGAGIPIDPATLAGRITVYAADPQNVFTAQLDASSAIATHALDNSLGGLILTTSANITTFTIDTNAARAQQLLRILRPDESDPLYNVAPASGNKGRVFFQFLETFDQGLLGVNYTGQ